MTDDDLEQMAALGPVIVAAVRRGDVAALAGLFAHNLLALVVAGRMLALDGPDRMPLAERTMLARAVARTMTGIEKPGLHDLDRLGLS